MSPKDPDAPAEPIDLASPPCLLHEIDPAYSGLAPAGASPTCDAAHTQPDRAAKPAPKK